MAGAFGYELDLQKLTGDEKEMVKAQIARCKQLQPLLLEGRCERLTNAVTDTCFTAWQFTAPRPRPGGGQRGGDRPAGQPLAHPHPAARAGP